MKNIPLMLFVNEQKKEEKHPDYTAKIKIGEEFMECGCGWKKTSAKGTKFLSVSLQQVPIRKLMDKLAEDEEFERSQNPSKDF